MNLPETAESVYKKIEILLGKVNHYKCSTMGGEERAGILFLTLVKWHHRALLGASLAEWSCRLSIGRTICKKASAAGF